MSLCCFSVMAQVFFFQECCERRDDLLVSRVCSRSAEELSAGPPSLLRSAPVSYPASRGQEVSQHIP